MWWAIKYVAQNLPCVFQFLIYCTARDCRLCLACPDVLSPLAELLSGDGWGSSNHIQLLLFSFLLIDLFILYIKVLLLSS
jgi:hypothetical protein